MKNNPILISAISMIVVLGALSCFAQNPQPDEALMEQARTEYLSGKFDDAVHDFRELANRNPSNITAQLYLGHSLFREEKYAEAVIPYEKAHQLEAKHPLSLEQHRILIDQLAMSYGISGKLKMTHDLLETAILEDSEYPLNYYNLACAFAEEGNKGKMLANLSLAFERKDNLLRGEQMPDPRKDSSFQQYIQDKDFIRLMKKLGYE